MDFSSLSGIKGELRSFSIFQYVTENGRIVFNIFFRSPQIFIDFEIEVISFVEILNSTLDFIKEMSFGRESDWLYLHICNISFIYLFIHVGRYPDDHAHMHVKKARRNIS